MAQFRRGFPVVLTLFTAAAFVLLVTLGGWQVRRLEWKQDLLARIEAARTAPAQPIEDVLARAAAGQDVGMTRAEARCSGSSEPQPQLALYTLHDGEIGWRALAPCRLANRGYHAVLVDRGVLRNAGSGLSAPDIRLPPPVSVVGVVREAEGPNAVQRLLRQPEGGSAGYHFRLSAVAAAERATGLRTPPLVLVAERETPPPPGLTPAALPTNLSNNHLGYAITWFGLAGALLAVYAAALVRGRRSG